MARVAAAGAVPAPMTAGDQDVARREMLNTWIAATTGHRLDTSGDKASARPTRASARLGPLGKISSSFATRPVHHHPDPPLH